LKYYYWVFEMTRRSLRIITQCFPDRPALDVALSQILLQSVADNTEPETLRLYRPGPVVVFGPQDARAVGYQKAVQASRDGGFDTIQRLAGGRAAVFHWNTIAFVWTNPDPHNRSTIEDRFQQMTSFLVATFRNLGIDARIGEVPGEYCPGRFSVNARGRKKIAGVGQRVVSRAAHVGGVIVVDGSEHVRDILIPVYDALQLEWDPNTSGSLADEVTGITLAEVHQAFIDDLAVQCDIFEDSFSPDAIAQAEAIENLYHAGTSIT
jgi:octanoyl-[GcvH]:protein N-octanoyltransferase